MVKLTGTNPDQVPTNADLGDMAYKDGENLQAGPLTIKDGNVGVGTTDPSSELHVKGGAYTPVTIDGTSGGTLDFYRNGSRHAQIFTDNAGGDIVFRNNTTTERMRITSTGEVKVTSGLLELDGNDIGGTQVTIADDAVASITPPRNGGFMFITAAGNSDYPQAVIASVLYYDVGLSLQLNRTTFGGVGGSMDVVTTDLTGTTGTDGRATVTVQTGVIKIENRYNQTITFQITFL